MRNTNKIVFFVMVSLSIIFFSSNIFLTLAHSGRTDGDGGHTNHATGEYHWHHGYSAHQHYDKDGDGYPEYCPYRIQQDNDSENEDSNDCGREDCSIEGPHGHINKDKTDTNSNSKGSSISWEGIIVCIILVLIFGPPIIIGLYSNVIRPIIADVKKKK